MTDADRELLALFNECLDLLICMEYPELGTIDWQDATARQIAEQMLLRESTFVSPMQMALQMRRNQMKPRHIADLTRSAAAKAAWHQHRMHYTSGIRNYRSSYQSRRVDRAVSRGMSLFNQLDDRNKDKS